MEKIKLKCKLDSGEAETAKTPMHRHSDKLWLAKMLRIRPVGRPRDSIGVTYVGRLTYLRACVCFGWRLLQAPNAV